MSEASETSLNLVTIEKLIQDLALPVRVFRATWLYSRISRFRKTPGTANLLEENAQEIDRLVREYVRQNPED